MQQAVAPSYSLGDTLSLKDGARPASLTPHATGLTGCGPMWRAEGSLPCWGPCSCMEARLHLSATVLRSTTLAGQPGHSPQPLH